MYMLKSPSPIHFVKILLPGFLHKEFIVRCLDLNKITP